MTQLMNRWTKTMPNLTCELIESSTMDAFRHNNAKALATHAECRSISGDESFKLTMKGGRPDAVA